MDVVTAAFETIDRLNTDEYKEFSFDLLQKELAELKGIQRLIDNTIAECDRIIREHEASPEHILCERRMQDKVMLKERAARIQRLATQVQTLMKMP